MIEAQRAKVAAAITARAAKQDALLALRASDTLTEAEVASAVAERDTADAALNTERAELERLEGEERREREIADLAARVAPSASAQHRTAYDAVARVASEPRTYTRENDPRGAQFERDVASAFLGDYEARDRVARHQQEERIERPGQIRAAGTGAFSGLVVPQYLTELYAPKAAARRPFADAINKHPLPAQGMTVNLSRITTSTSTAVQTENAAASETDIDDTLLTVNVQTNAGQQTLSRQAIERGAGVEPVTLDDLFRQYHTMLDSTLLNQATNGLTNVATAIAYTDASPTVAELYPKFSQASAAVEAALMDMSSGENIAVMHSRRWYWLQNAMVSTWPAMAQPGIVAQMLGTNFAERYGSGVRGVLPNNTPVIVDNNIGTTLGGGTEDEIFVVDKNECHLWEDPSAPMYIRAEQTKAASLGVLMVVYGYFAYTHARYSHAQKINGTGLAAPTFTGV
jgi:hypothetical protein